MINTIQNCKPVLTAGAKRNVISALNNLNLSGTASPVKEFEKDFSKFLTLNNCYRQVVKEEVIACNSGTSALYCALATLKKLHPEKEEVLVCNFNISSVLFAIESNNLRPIFIDSDEYLTIDVGCLKRKCNPQNTLAVVVTHNYMNVADMPKISQFCDDNNIDVVEDCAEQPFAKYQGDKLVGMESSFACYSFYANKILTAGEGGAIVAKNRTLADYCRTAVNCGFGKVEKYKNTMVTGNSRMPALQAAILSGNLEQVNYEIFARNYIASFYDVQLDDMFRNRLLFGTKIRMNTRPNVWLYGIFIGAEKSAEDVRIAMAQKGIECKRLFTAISSLYKGGRTIKVDTRTKIGTDCGLILPTYSGLCDFDLSYVVQTLKMILKD